MTHPVGDGDIDRQVQGRQSLLHALGAVELSLDAGEVLLLALVLVVEVPGPLLAVNLNGDVRVVVPSRDGGLRCT